MTCQVKNLPSRYELHWAFNDKIIDAKIIDEKNTEIKSQKVSDELKSNVYSLKKRSVSSEDNTKRTRNIELITIANHLINNVTISKLKIKDLADHNKGVYRCKYDKIEAKFHLDFKSKGIF